MHVLQSNIFAPNIIEFGKNIDEKENIYEDISHYRTKNLLPLLKWGGDFQALGNMKNHLRL